MRKGFYPVFAAQSIKKNGKFFFPYILTSTITASLYFIIVSMASSESLKNIYGGSHLQMILTTSMVVVTIFFAIFLFYTQSFLTKRRKTEYGLYSVLGMEKKHICLLAFFELLYTLAVTLCAGIPLGALFSRLVYMALLRILKFESTPVFELNAFALTATAIVFCVIFALGYINTVRIIGKSNPMELLTSAKAGEREPRSKLVITLIGIISLVLGYVMALTVESPLNAVNVFLIAVILVMIGTYCLFASGSIALLKALKKNTGYYYKAKHFISVSGMMYRMKQNAVGLANICILCTAVLVTISSTVSLYAGMESLLRNRFPRNITITLESITDEACEEVKSIIDDCVTSGGITPVNDISLRSTTLLAAKGEDGFLRYTGNEGTSYYSQFIAIPLANYNALTGSNVTLGDGELLFGELNHKYDGDTIRLGDSEFKIAQRIDNLDIATRQYAIMLDTYYIVLPDIESVRELALSLGREAAEAAKIEFNYEYLFDSEQPAQVQTDFISAVSDSLEEAGYPAQTECAEGSRDTFYSLYGGLLFVGIFFGIVFMLAAVLIIYYKQVSEGFDDRERYKIMKNVGMGESEIKKTVRSQILTVFFLPLITAFIHLAFAFPVLTKLLAVLNLTDISVFVVCLIITAAAFAGIYALVYSATAKVYYKMVK